MQDMKEYIGETQACKLSNFVPNNEAAFTLPTYFHANIAQSESRDSKCPKVLPTRAPLNFYFKEKSTPSVNKQSNSFNCELVAVYIDISIKWSFLFQIGWSTQ